MSEIEATKLNTSKAKYIKAPLIKEAKIAMECRLHKIIEIGDIPMNMVFGEILAYHIEDDYVENYIVDSSKISPLGRLGKNYLKFDKSNILDI